jgi:hypothetical protein
MALTAKTYGEAYKLSHAAAWDAGIRATKRGEDFGDAAVDTFNRVMAALGYPIEQLEAECERGDEPPHP